MRKPWVKIVLAVVVVIVLVVVIVPFFVNADSFRPMLENQLSSAVGRKVTLGHLSFSLLSGSLVADNVAIADDPAYSNQPFFQAKSLHIGVDTGAFLFHRQINIRKFVANAPEIHLISGQNGGWNYASLGRGGPSSGSSSSSVQNLTVGVLQIEDGKVVVSSIPATGQPFVYDNVKVKVENLSFTQAMPFEVAANLPGNGTLTLQGTAGPVAKPDASLTPVKASLEVKHFDPVAAGVIPASEGIGMVADLSAQLASDGKTLTSTGKVSADHLLLSRAGTPAPRPVDLNYTTSYDLHGRTGQLSPLSIQTGRVAVQVTGTYQMAGSTVALNLHASAPNLPVDQVEQFLPAVGVRLPSGSSLKGGTLTANLAVTGTAAAPDIAGPVEIDNTMLSGFDLGSKIQGLKATGGTAGGTAIRTLRANLHSTVPSTEIANLYADVPAIGTATGGGTVTAAGGLNFQLVAKLSASSAPGALIGSAANALGGIAGNLLHSAVNNGIPLTVTGTTANPVIRADVSQMLKGGVGGKSGQTPQQGVGGLLQGLFGKKKQ